MLGHRHPSRLQSISPWVGGAAVGLSTQHLCRGLMVGDPIVLPAETAVFARRMKQHAGGCPSPCSQAVHLGRGQLGAWAGLWYVLQDLIALASPHSAPRHDANRSNSLVEGVSVWPRE